MLIRHILFFIFLFKKIRSEPLRLFRFTAGSAKSRRCALVKINGAEHNLLPKNLISFFLSFFFASSDSAGKILQISDWRSFPHQQCLLKRGQLTQLRRELLKSLKCIYFLLWYMRGSLVWSGRRGEQTMKWSSDVSKDINSAYTSPRSVHKPITYIAYCCQANIGWGINILNPVPHFYIIHVVFLYKD